MFPNIGPTTLVGCHRRNDWRRRVRCAHHKLARCGGRIKIAARLPGIACTALRDRIEKYGLSAVA
jgi:hypothetical protein